MPNAELSSNSSLTNGSVFASRRPQSSPALRGRRKLRRGRPPAHEAGCASHEYPHQEGHDPKRACPRRRGNGKEIHPKALKLCEKHAHKRRRDVNTLTRLENTGERKTKGGRKRKKTDSETHKLPVQTTDVVPRIDQREQPIGRLGVALIDALEDEMMAIIVETAHDYALTGTDKGIEIVASKLGDDAGIVGASELARKNTR